MDGRLHSIPLGTEDEKQLRVVRTGVKDQTFDKDFRVPGGLKFL